MAKREVLLSCVSFLATLCFIFVFFNTGSGKSEVAKPTRHRRDVEAPVDANDDLLTKKEGEREAVENRIKFTELWDGTYSYSRYSAKTWSKIDPDYFITR